LRHLATTGLIWEHIERLKYFKGNLEDAQRLANVDAEQFFIRRIQFYLGDPEPNKINSLEIVVEFDDEEVYFLGCDKDITETNAFLYYAYEHRELFWLTIDSPLRANYINGINNTLVPKYVVGYTAYTKLRFWGFDWFERLSLPKLMRNDDANVPKDYICSYVIMKKSNNSKRFDIKVPSVSNKTFKVSLFWFSAYGYIEVFDSNCHELVDDNLILNFPMIRDDSAREGVV